VPASSSAPPKIKSLQPTAAERFDRGSRQDNVDTPHPTPSQSRAAAITELFVALEALLRTYQSLPADEREDRFAADADLITGEIARRLAVARAGMSHTLPPAGGLTAHGNTPAGAAT
jgi:hypothetical protein